MSSFHSSNFNTMYKWRTEKLEEYIFSNGYCCFPSKHSNELCLNPAPSGSVQAKEDCFSVEVRFGRNVNPNGKFIVGNQLNAKSYFVSLASMFDKIKKIKKNTYLAQDTRSKAGVWVLWLLHSRSTFWAKNTSNTETDKFSIIKYWFRVFKNYNSLL